MRFVGGTLILLALLAGCASSPDAQPPGSPGSPDDVAPTVVTGIELVNLWRVSDAAGEGDETWLRLDVPEFQLWRECGMISGTWKTAGSLFIAGTHSANGCVDESGIPSAPWLESATSYLATDGGFALTDASGAVVAQLTIDGAPEPIATAAEFYTQPPEITEAVRQAFEPPAGLPAGVEPATAAELLGEWFSPTAPRAAFVEFSDDGEWSGSDGCNGASGRWLADGDGSILATTGPTTLIGCDGAAIPYWLAAASSAGFHGEELVLFDPAGAEIGRLIR